MSRQQSTIEINGKLYDARTGKLLQTSSRPAAAPAKRTPALVRGKADPSVRVHRAVERSKTLMRQAVKKPITQPRPKATPARRVTDVATPARAVRSLLPRVAPVDPARQARAASVKKSDLISRFNLDMKPRRTVPQPKASAAQPAAALSIATPAARRNTANASPAKSRAKASAVQTMLENGLRAAQSHTETPKKVRKTRTKRRRLTAALATGLSVLLLGVFIAYQNVPNIAIRYASTRAGIDASLPGWRPAGFALDRRIQYTPGQITVNFQSNSDDRSFTISQRESNWNSETLRENYVAAKDDNIHTYEDKGRTIYLYGESNATWISGGIWYDIKGNSQLNSDQLIRIATSM